MCLLTLISEYFQKYPATAPAWCSVFVAGLALWFTIQQNKRARVHNQLSVRPFLTLWVSRDSSRNTYRIDLVNNGIGPALIEKSRVFVDDKLILGKEDEPLKNAVALLFQDYTHASGFAYVNKGYCMPSKEKITLLTIQFSKPAIPDPLFVAAAIERANIEISYKSFYEEEFILSSKELRKLHAQEIHNQSS